MVPLSLCLTEMLDIMTSPQQPLVNEELSLSSIVELAIERALISRFRDRIVASLKRPAKYLPSLAKNRVCANACCPSDISLGKRRCDSRE